jgi:GT2 family glycosyltransferase
LINRRDITDVTAIIKTFLRDDYLFDCVWSMRSAYPNMPIFVADDGHPSDEKEAKLKDLGVTKYVRVPFDSGLSRGRNILVDMVETPYLLLSDDDHLYTPTTHVEYLRTLMEIADVASGGFLEPNGVFHFERKLILRGDGRFEHTGSGWPEFSVHNGVRYGKCDMTHNFFVARTDLVRSVRWDDDIRIRYEHEDFFYRLWLENTTEVYSPDALLLHKAQGFVQSKEYRSHRQDDVGAREIFKQKWGYDRDIPSPPLPQPPPKPPKPPSPLPPPLEDSEFMTVIIKGRALRIPRIPRKHRGANK